MSAIHFKSMMQLNPSTLDGLRELGASVPILKSSDYYIKPCSQELSSTELLDPGYCSRVKDFTVGRLGYGSVKFLGETDVRWLNLEEIVKFQRHEIVVYEDETTKPPVGEGLNKPAEVTLILQSKSADLLGKKFNNVADYLRSSADRQGARFISYDPLNGQWKFLVHHFSRFGLGEDEEEDTVMDDADATAIALLPVVMNGDPNYVEERFHRDPDLSHSLPAHLGLDPVKMNEMRMLMFPFNEEDDEIPSEIPSHEKQPFHGEHIRSPYNYSDRIRNHRPSPQPTRKTPLALLEYNSSSFDLHSSGTILMSQDNKGLPLRAVKAEGFKQEAPCDTPVTRSHYRNIVDAGLFMGRSFRVGWGPNGVLVHSGTPVTGNVNPGNISSLISIERVAIDKVARDESNKLKDEAVDSFFDCALDLHKSLDHEAMKIEFDFSSLNLQKVVSDRLKLSSICQNYIQLIEGQLELSGLSSSLRLSLMHQVIVWDLVRVLFSDRENSGLSRIEEDDEEDMMQDSKDGPSEIDLEALPLVRRAEFSNWLQESVYHRVQEDVSCLDDSNYLEHILLLLSGRQLDTAVEMAASKGDVRLACLLSQAGGSMMNRSDVSQQLEIWKNNGLDFNFVHKDRVRLYELLAGHVHDALYGKEIDWKRFLGLLMWFALPPDTPLPSVFHTYQHLLAGGKAPYPAPCYIDEGPPEEANSSSRHYDLAFYLILLHANESIKFVSLKSMFSTFASTNDPLDYHMIWHQRAILEAIGAFSSEDLHILDMGFVSQLLCLGQCHWAIYVVLHMPYREDLPDLQFKYCDTWSTIEKQRQFIEELGIPLVWLHEAMAVYYQYYGDLPKALEHFIECEYWQKAHSIFITSVAHSLYLSGSHAEVWRLATSMEEHKSEIDDWDLGAGIYVSFYVLRSDMKDDGSTNKPVSLEDRDVSCKEFFDKLQKSLAVLDSKLPVDARVAYSKMAEEICSLFLFSIKEDPTREIQLNCFNTMASAPLPEDVRSYHVQDAIALFMDFLSEQIQQR
ncbi:hypothetical protein V2J09_015286 [Rumex salicifolius]